MIIGEFPLIEQALYEAYRAAQNEDGGDEATWEELSQEDKNWWKEKAGQIMEQSDGC